MLPSSPFFGRKEPNPPETCTRLARRVGACAGNWDTVGCYEHAATARAPRGGVAGGHVPCCRGLRQLEPARRGVEQYELDRGRVRRLSGIQNRRRNLCTSLAGQRLQRRPAVGDRQPRDVCPCAERPFDRSGTRIHRQPAALLRAGCHRDHARRRRVGAVQTAAGGLVDSDAVACVRTPTRSRSPPRPPPSGTSRRSPTWPHIHRR